MFANMYKIIFTGNVGKDAEVREIKGYKVINFTVAIKVSKELTQWTECAIWRKLDQSVGIADYLKKGTKVLIEGEPSVEIYNEKAYLKTKVGNVELLGTAPAQNQTEDVPF
jgi:single-strand DNA-binding protein